MSKRAKQDESVHEHDSTPAVGGADAYAQNLPDPVARARLKARNGVPEDEATSDLSGSETVAYWRFRVMDNPTDILVDEFAGSLERHMVPDVDRLAVGR